MSMFVRNPNPIPLTGKALVRQRCRELNWCIDTEDGNAFGLDFNGDQVTSVRMVGVVTHEGHENDLISFLCRSRAEFSSHSLPDGLLPALLFRNAESFGSWYATTDGNDKVRFTCEFTAPSAGIDAAFFQTVCLRLSEEVGNVERELHRKGLL